MMVSIYIKIVVSVYLPLASCFHQEQISIPIPSVVDVRYIYTLYTIPKSWNEAVEICHRNGGGRLITISSLGVLNFIKELQTSSWSGSLTDYWTGLSEGQQGVFRWQDCSYSNPSFSNFKGDSYKADELCYFADVSSDHTWSNGKCSDAKIFICENTQGCDLSTNMISTIDFKSHLTTEEACNAECDNDVSCWGVLSLGTWGCNILKMDNTTINGVVKFNSKSCVCEASMVTDPNAIPSVTDTSLIPRENCSFVQESSLTASETTQTSTFTLATSTPYLTTDYPIISTSSSEINCTNIVNVTVTEVQMNTEIISVTNFINIVSTVFDIHQESVYITVFVTSSDVFTKSCSCSQSVYENILNCSYSVTQTAICSSSNTNTVSTIDSLQLEHNLESMRRELTVHKNSTSAYQRKFISVADSRPSATAIGYTGAIFLVISILLILVSDLPKCIRLFKSSISSYRGYDT